MGYLGQNSAGIEPINGEVRGLVFTERLRSFAYFALTEKNAVQTALNSLRPLVPRSYQATQLMAKLLEIELPIITRDGLTANYDHLVILGWEAFNADDLPRAQDIFRCAGLDPRFLTGDSK